MKKYKNFKIKIKMDDDFNLFYYIITDDQDHIIYDAEGCDGYAAEAEAEAKAKKTIDGFIKRWWRMKEYSEKIKNSKEKEFLDEIDKKYKKLRGAKNE